MSSRRRTRERTRCMILGRPGVRVARRFACLDPVEAERLMELGRATPVPGGGDYDSEDECEARCSALAALPPEMAGAVVGALPATALPQYVRTARMLRPEARRELELERQACLQLAQRYPPVGQYVNPYDPAAVADTCARYGLPCRRHCAEILDRLAGGEIVVPFRAFRQRVGGSRYDVYQADLMEASPTAARLWARPARIRDLLPSARDLPVLREGDVIRIPDARSGNVAYLLDTPSERFVDVSTSRNGEILLDFILIDALELQSYRSMSALYVVPPFPAVSPAALRGDLGLDAQLGAMENNARLFEEFIGIPAGSIDVNPEATPPQYWLDEGDVAEHLVTFFATNGVPFHFLEIYV